MACLVGRRVAIIRFSGSADPGETSSRKTRVPFALRWYHLQMTWLSTIWGAGKPSGLWPRLDDLTGVCTDSGRRQLKPISAKSRSLLGLFSDAGTIQLPEFGYLRGPESSGLFVDLVPFILFYVV